jgi:hypothetical protein
MRTLGSLLLANGSGCGSGRPKNIRIRITGTITSFFKENDVIKKLQNRRNQGFLLVMEESRNGSVLVTNGSGYGSWRPKNIRILRIRIPNTAVNITITLDLRGEKTHFSTDIGRE